jgi:hypothetical protein
LSGSSWKERKKYASREVLLSLSTPAFKLGFLGGKTKRGIFKDWQESSKSALNSLPPQPECLLLSKKGPFLF